MTVTVQLQTWTECSCVLQIFFRQMLSSIMWHNLLMTQDMTFNHTHRYLTQKGTSFVFIKQSGEDMTIKPSKMSPNRPHTEMTHWGFGNMIIIQPAVFYEVRHQQWAVVYRGAPYLNFSFLCILRKTQMVGKLFSQPDPVVWAQDLLRWFLMFAVIQSQMKSSLSSSLLVHNVSTYNKPESVWFRANTAGIVAWKPFTKPHKMKCLSQCSHQATQPRHDWRCRQQCQRWTNK